VPVVHLYFEMGNWGKVCFLCSIGDSVITPPETLKKCGGCSDYCCPNHRLDFSNCCCVCVTCSQIPDEKSCSESGNETDVEAEEEEGEEEKEKIDSPPVCKTCFEELTDSRIAGCEKCDNVTCLTCLVPTLDQSESYCPDCYYKELNPDPVDPLVVCKHCNYFRKQGELVYAPWFGRPICIPCYLPLSVEYPNADLQWAKDNTTIF
jgi:hypothetical protein